MGTTFSEYFLLAESVDINFKGHKLLLQFSQVILYYFLFQLKYSKITFGKKYFIKIKFIEDSISDSVIGIIIASICGMFTILLVMLLALLCWYRKNMEIKHMLKNPTNGIYNFIYIFSKLKKPSWIKFENLSENPHDN